MSVAGSGGMQAAFRVFRSRILRLWCIRVMCARCELGAMHVRACVRACLHAVRGIVPQHCLHPSQCCEVGKRLLSVIIKGNAEAVVEPSERMVFG